MARKLLMGRLVVLPSAPGGPIIQALAGPPRPPHSMCDKRSWCQPADVALAALQQSNPLR